MAQTKETKKARKTRTKAKAACVKMAADGENHSEDAPIMIYYKWCKGCGICVAFCPKKVLDFDEAEQLPLLARPQDCIQCGLCELRCPDFAITRVRKNPRNGNHEQDNGEEKE